MASKQICDFYHLQPAEGFWTWKRDRVIVFPGCAKNSTAALENKGNCIAGCSARDDLHTRVELHRNAKEKGKKKGKKTPPLAIAVYHCACWWIPGTS